MLLLNSFPVEMNTFPDGTPLIKLDNSSYTETFMGEPVNTITWHFENNAEFMFLTMLVGHIRNTFRIKDIDLELPYIPNARQDRVHDYGDVFTLKYFADAINALNFSHVIVLDPHSSVSESLFNRLVVLSPAEAIRDAFRTITRHTKNEPALFYPDEGAMKRYSKMGNGRFAFGIKQRDWATGEIKGLTLSGDVDYIKDRDVLIIDDICSRGGTFYHSAKALKEAGAKDVYLYVSHCENTIFKGELLDGDLIAGVYTTNSIYTGSHPKIHIVNYHINRSYPAYRN